MASSIYEYSALDQHGTVVPLNTYRGRPALIVNVASQCGFTPQYAGLEQLWRSYGPRGLIVLGFPCNQFGDQEPGDDAAIAKFCTTTYGISFPIFSKIKVNGPETHPLYKYLKHALPGVGGSELIKWNFTKFLINSTGKPIGRFASATQPEALIEKIEALLT